MVQSIGITLVSADVARKIAGTDPRFDLFDRPPGELSPGDASAGKDSAGAVAGIRPLVIALLPDSLEAGRPREDLAGFFRNGNSRREEPDQADREIPDVETPLCLVWGHCLLERLSGDDLLPAVLVDMEKGDSSLLRTALAQEARAGRYSWREMDRIYQAAREIGADDPDDLVSPSRPVGPLIVRYRALPERLQEALERDLLDMRTAERVSGLPGELLRSVLELAEPLSFSRRRQFLTAADDLCRGGKKASLEEILRAFSRENAGSGGRAEEAFRELLNCRYPRLRRLEGAVQAVQQGLLRGSGVRLEPPPRFEGSRYRISFEVGSVDELRRRLGAVQKMEHELDELLELLFQDPLDDSLAP
ncbi:hypothetical protein [Alkalispirochaeta americana]|uniref:hypothetical protein n=1 Tax=Alkalispirochaeta americana TaxID=159291 RepID=UPI00097126EF|nr:hypothetical protein [Alkalispirochaeta americana]